MQTVPFSTSPQLFGFMIISGIVSPLWPFLTPPHLFLHPISVLFTVTLSFPPNTITFVVLQYGEISHALKPVIVIIRLSQMICFTVILASCYVNLF